MTDTEASANTAEAIRKRLKIERESTPDFWGEVVVKLKVERGVVVGVRVEGAQYIR